MRYHPGVWDNPISISTQPAIIHGCTETKHGFLSSAGGIARHIGAVRKRTQLKGKLMGKTAWTNEIRLTAGVQGHAPRKESRIALIWALKRSPWRTAASPHL